MLLNVDPEMKQPLDSHFAYLIRALVFTVKKKKTTIRSAPPTSNPFPFPAACVWCHELLLLPPSNTWQAGEIQQKEQYSGHTRPNRKRNVKSVAGRANWRYHHRLPPALCANPGTRMRNERELNRIAPAAGWPAGLPLCSHTSHNMLLNPFSLSPHSFSPSSLRLGPSRKHEQGIRPCRPTEGSFSLILD